MKKKTARLRLSKETVQHLEAGTQVAGGITTSAWFRCGTDSNCCVSIGWTNCDYCYL